MKYKLFLDLDGVFADLHGWFESRHGPDWEEKVNAEGYWQELAKTEPRLFSQLETLPLSLETINFLVSIQDKFDRISFLTAKPSRGNFKYAELDKTQWVANVLGSNWPVIANVYAKDKQIHCEGPTCILIDDNKSNIQRWIKAGGIGILHLGYLPGSMYNLIKTINGTMESP